jgi:hypothetical protein
MWRKYLTNLGYTDYSIDQKAMRYLGDLGYTGSITNRWYQYWKNGGPIPLARSLFRSGEDGFLFGNFAELDELYKTSTDGGNVSTNDDPVGLILDDHAWGRSSLSTIIASATELVTNGQFSVDTTGWTANGSTLAAVTGQLEITSTGSGFAARALYSFTTEVGKTYRMSLNSLTVGNAIRVGTTAAGVDVIPNTGIGIVNGYEVYFVAASTTTHIGLIGSAVLGGKNYFDDVSVKLIPGNHALQATAANRPLWKANAGKPYLLLDGSNDALIGSFFPMATGTGLTMAIAFNSTQGAVQTIPMGGGSATARAFIAIIANGRLGIGWGSQVNQAGGSDLRNANHVVVVTGEGESRDVWLDGVNITADFAAAVGTPVSTGGPITLGGRQATVGGAIDQNMPGNISAAVALNRRVTPAEIGQITSNFRSTF